MNEQGQTPFCVFKNKKLFLHKKQVVGNSLKSLEVSEEKANQRVEEFKRQLKSLTIKLKEAENRAELAEKTVKKLQKEVDRLEGMNLVFWNISNCYIFFQKLYLIRKRKKKYANFCLATFIRTRQQFLFAIVALHLSELIFKP